jgi:hypothetical protein
MIFLGLEFERLTYKVCKYYVSDKIEFVIRIDYENSRFIFNIENDHYTIDLLNVKIDNVAGSIEEIIERNNIYQHLCNHELMLPFNILGNRTEKIKILL